MGSYALGGVLSEVAPTRYSEFRHRFVSELFEPRAPAKTEAPLACQWQPGPPSLVLSPLGQGRQHVPPAGLRGFVSHPSSPPSGNILPWSSWPTYPSPPMTHPPPATSHAHRPAASPQAVGPVGELVLEQPSPQTDIARSNNNLMSSFMPGGTSKQWTEAADLGSKRNHFGVMGWPYQISEKLDESMHSTST